MNKHIFIKSFDWKEVREANSWIHNMRIKGYKIYNYDTQQDAYAIIAVKNGVLTKEDLKRNMPSGYQSLSRAKLLKGLIEIKGWGYY